MIPPTANFVQFFSTLFLNENIINLQKFILFSAPEKRKYAATYFNYWLRRKKSSGHKITGKRTWIELQSWGFVFFLVISGVVLYFFTHKISHIEIEERRRIVFWEIEGSRITQSLLNTCFDDSISNFTQQQHLAQLHTTERDAIVWEIVIVCWRKDNKMIIIVDVSYLLWKMNLADRRIIKLKKKEKSSLKETEIGCNNLISNEGTKKQIHFRHLFS